jgi:hypothetical protein
MSAGKPVRISRRTALAGARPLADIEAFVGEHQAA